MATISRFGPFSHLRAESNQFILHYKRGQVIVKGRGLAYWFLPLSAAVAQVPAEDIDTTFLLRERTSDLQEVAVQCTVTYRVSELEQATQRVNFSIGLDNGAWKEQPLERLATLWAQRAQQPTRSYLSTVPVVEAVRSGAEKVQAAIDSALRGDADLSAMGLSVVGVQVNQVAPTPELEKALQTPTRESLQQKADEAVFERRAVAVEKERAIKENELQSEIELARRQEDLIKQQGQNRLEEIRQEAEAEKERVQTQGEREELVARNAARDTLTRAEGKASATQVLAAAATEGERQRVAVYAEAPTKVVLGLALQKFAERIDSINHLNLTPELLGQVAQQFLQEQADQ